MLVPRQLTVHTGQVFFCFAHVTCVDLGCGPLQLACGDEFDTCFPRVYYCDGITHCSNGFDEKCKFQGEVVFFCSYPFSISSFPSPLFLINIVLLFLCVFSSYLSSPTANGPS